VLGVFPVFLQTHKTLEEIIVELKMMGRWNNDKKMSSVLHLIDFGHGGPQSN
jgi:hypothetical protein